jgi:hypothetical protein
VVVEMNSFKKGATGENQPTYRKGVRERFWHPVCDETLISWFPSLTYL